MCVGETDVKLQIFLTPTLDGCYL